jgi:hypothetical protein
METLQKTTNEKVVDLYPYKFKVSETGASPPVVVAVTNLDDGDFDRDDSSSIRFMFDDIGKWESFVQSASAIVKELGLSQPDGTLQNFHYSPSKYDFTEDTTRDETLRRFYVHVNKDERYRRKALNIPTLTSSEIVTGIENVAKWRSLAETSKLIRSFWK